uniref:Solute carrier family 29 member 2 n=1 Tax=Sinocyclocheilus rhinocerous TaxID=307959 RepID=A0A673ICR4_9TELE
IIAWIHTPGFLVGIIFFILGLGTLLPWNFFMTVSMYFNNRLNTSEWSNGTVTTRKEYYFNNWMTLLSQLPLLLFTLLNSFLYQWISEKMRIAGSLVFILLLFILTAVLVKIPMEEDRFFSVTMATIWFINSFGAVLQGSLFFFVCFLPQSYSAVFMSGQGLAGTFAALAMIFAIAKTLTWLIVLIISLSLSLDLADGVLCDVCAHSYTASFPVVTVDVKTVYGGKWGTKHTHTTQGAMVT